MGFNDFNDALNALEADLNFPDAQSMWNYAVYGINVSAAPYHKLKALHPEINDSTLLSYLTRPLLSFFGGINSSVISPLLLSSAFSKKAL